jgi:hypothetical protein
MYQLFVWNGDRIGTFVGQQNALFYLTEDETVNPGILVLADSRTQATAFVRDRSNIKVRGYADPGKCLSTGDVDTAVLRVCDIEDDGQDIFDCKVVRCLPGKEQDEEEWVGWLVGV